MKLSKTSALASLAMAHLASIEDNRLVQARQVAEQLGIPTDSALKILQSLARRGLIDSQLGRGGGYRMKREPSSISLLEVIEAIDGPIQASIPVQVETESVVDSLEVLHGICGQAAAKVRAELANLSVSDLNVQPASPVLAQLH